MFYIYILILIVVSKGQDDFFVTIQNNSYTCVTNSSYGLAWITNNTSTILNYVSDFIPQQRQNDFDSDIRSDYKTKTYFEKKPWTLKKSYDEIIFDRRWEDLKVYLTTSSEAENWKYTVVASNLKDNFEIPVSIRIQHEAQIFLCDGHYPHHSNCYWFILDGFINKGPKSAIRKCDRYTIPLKGLPKRPCRTLRNETLTHLVSRNYWSHFKLTKKGHFFTLKSLNSNESILQLKDDSIRVTHMIIHSKRMNGLWKIHQLEYIYTNKETDQIQMGPIISVTENFVCVSMFVAMCESCQLKLTLKSKNVSIREETFSQQIINEKSKWSEIKFVVDSIQMKEVRLFVSTIGTNQEKRFWTIDKVRLCQKKEFHRISLAQEASCQLISHNHQIISSTTDAPQNPSDHSKMTVCTPCQWIYESCDNVRICKEHLNTTTSGSWCSIGHTNFPNCKKKLVDAPYDLHIKWTLQNDMLLEWKQSNVRESKIGKFHISVYPVRKRKDSYFYKSLKIDKNDQNSTYSYKVDAVFLMSSVLYAAEVTADNMSNNQSAKTTDLSPPERPSLQFPPKTITSESTIIVEIVPRPNTTVNITVLVTDSSDNSYLHPELNFEDNEILQELSKSRTIYCVENLNQNYSFVIGNGSETNPYLVSGTFYKITLILSHTFKNKTSYKIYFLNCSTLSNLLHLLSLLVLLLIPIIAIIIYSKRQIIRNYFTRAGPRQSFCFREDGDYSVDNEIYGSIDSNEPQIQLEAMVENSLYVQSKRLN